MAAWLNMAWACYTELQISLSCTEHHELFSLLFLVNSAESLRPCDIWRGLQLWLEVFSELGGQDDWETAPLGYKKKKP